MVPRDAATCLKTLEIRDVSLGRTRVSLLDPESRTPWAMTQMSYETLLQSGTGRLSS